MKLLSNAKHKMEGILQAVALIHIFVTFFLGPLFSMAISLYILFFTRLYPLLLLYMVWIYVDRDTCKREGRRLAILRNTGLWRYYRDYFPQKLVKTADLPPTSNYIFCCFPHGLVCSGVFSMCAWDDSEFHQMFPGLTLTCHTLNINFYMPFSREYILGLGFCSVSKDAILYHLKKPGGHVVSLLIGGSAEAMKSAPGTFRLMLKNRKGFVKLALLSGTPLVPVYVFGEVNLYDQTIYPKDSLVHKVQQLFRKVTGVAPCRFSGRGFLGMGPHRVPVTTVVGKPIPVERMEEPSSEQVDQLHLKFIERLTELFEEHKYKYVENPDSAHLSIED